MGREKFNVNSSLLSHDDYTFNISLQMQRRLIRSGYTSDPVKPGTGKTQYQNESFTSESPFQ